MTKKVAIMQPYFFPYLGYWQLFKAVDTYVIYDDVNYIKNGWINRNNILLNGQSHLITLPLDSASPFQLINQVKIIHDRNKKNKILKTIEQAYKKAPYFDSVFKIVESCILEESELISKALINSIEQIKRYLDIKTEIIVSSDLAKNTSLRGQDKVIHICKLLNGTDYINAIGGHELYSKEDFRENGLKLHFLKMSDVDYRQFKNEFVSNLSIIDVMMFNSPETINEMLDKYELF